MRDPLKQPFRSTSIWNHPIGSDARYVPANIKEAQAYGMTEEEDTIILTPGEPPVEVRFNGDSWSGGSRCSGGNVLFQAPIPRDFIVPGAHPGFTPNFSAAILAADGRTLIQAQPLTHCTADGDFTALVRYPDEDLFEDGIEGAHGGSGLSSIGGTIRLGELVPGGMIPHALKINIDAGINVWGTFGDERAGDSFRWPAVKADSCAPGCYGGTNPALKMGALLALRPSFSTSTLETEPARMIAQALKDYGGYVVDSTGWDVYAIATEFSPDGHVLDEFKQAWGFPWRESNLDTPWTRDMRWIFSALNVIDNNGPNIGGGGTPRVLFAEPLEDETPPAPPPTPTPPEPPTPPTPEPEPPTPPSVDCLVTVVIDGQPQWITCEEFVGRFGGGG